MNSEFEGMHQRNGTARQSDLFEVKGGASREPEFGLKFYARRWLRILKSWAFPVITCCLLAYALWNIRECARWIENFQTWEAESRRGKYHAHNRPKKDAAGNPLSYNPFPALIARSDRSTLLTYAVVVTVTVIPCMCVFFMVSATKL